MRIHEPRWTRPQLLLPGQTLSVTLGDCASARPAARLETERATCALEVASVEPEASVDGVTLRCRVPESAATGLWALHVSAAGRGVRMPNCVQVLEAFTPSYTFVHTSDIHIWKASAGAFIDRTRAVERMVAAINALEPAFVINTGDLISRYRTKHEPVGWEETERQTRDVRRRLLELRVAMFVTPGNHDIAFPWSRRAWRKHMGLPVDGGRDDYSFDFGEDHFTVLDASRCYDEQTHEMTDNPFEPAQLDWLVRDMSAPARRRFLCFHYDYRRQLIPLIEQLGIEGVFYGHSNKRTFTEPCPEGFIEGLLPGTHAFQTIHVSEAGTRLEPGPTWRELGEASHVSA